MEKPLRIYPKSIFIADAHFFEDKSQTLKDSSMDLSTKNFTGDKYDTNLLSLLENLAQNPPPQVFLMGDIAHLFIGHIPTSQKTNRAFIQAINNLAQKCEVFYFEGNHDFGIDMRILPNVKIYPRSMQPVHFVFEQSHLLLSHGDLFVGKAYEFYISLMNSALILSMFKIIDILTFGFLYRLIEHRIQHKKIKFFDMDLASFQAFSQERFSQYSLYAQKIGLSRLDGVIEGHFHIGKNTKNFISLPSFYCSHKVFIIESKSFLG